MRRLVVTILAVTLCLPGSVSLACAPDDICEPPALRRYPSYGRAIGITLDPEWIEQNIEVIHELFAPGCKAFGHCLSVWGNPIDFCRLLFTVDLRERCEQRFDIETDLRGWQQCKAVADVFSIRQRQAADEVWRDIQQCAADEAAGKIVPPVLQLDPAAPQPGTEVVLKVKAFEADSGYPAYGLVTVGGAMVGQTFDALNYTFRFDRGTDEFGRISFRRPVAEVRANPARESNHPGFPDQIAEFKTPIPTTRLTIDPPPEEWKSGKNVVTITAQDGDSGTALAGSIMRPGVVIGKAGDPVTIVLQGGERPCGEPVWFRDVLQEHPDESLPVAACNNH